MVFVCKNSQWNQISCLTGLDCSSTIQQYNCATSLEGKGGGGFDRVPPGPRKDTEHTTVAIKQTWLARLRTWGARIPISMSGNLKTFFFYLFAIFQFLSLWCLIILSGWHVYQAFKLSTFLAKHSFNLKGRVKKNGKKWWNFPRGDEGVYPFPPK